jgi:hypothetical protein
MIRDVHPGSWLTQNFSFTVISKKCAHVYHIFFLVTRYIFSLNLFFVQDIRQHRLDQAVTLGKLVLLKFLCFLHMTRRRALF